MYCSFSSSADFTRSIDIDAALGAGHDDLGQAGRLGSALTGECFSGNGEFAVGEECSWDAGEPHGDEHVLGVSEDEPDVDHWRFVASLLTAVTEIGEVVGGAVLALRPSVRAGGFVGTVDFLVVEDEQELYMAQRSVLLDPDEDTRDTLREVIPFPKTARAVDLMVDAPTPVSEAQLKELGIQVKK